MIAELGQWSLALALAIALVSSILGFWHLTRQSLSTAYLSRALTGTALLNFFLIALSFGALIWSFIANDFSVRNVAENSNSLLPTAYRFAASWGSHEGSLLLWVLMLAGWTAAVALRSANLAHGFRARVMAVLLILQVAFIGLLLASSNPFLRLLPAALEGRDLNPLLQDPVMVIHPPMLYMGYVGFAVTFAFSIMHSHTIDGTCLLSCDIHFVKEIDDFLFVRNGHIKSIQLMHRNDVRQCSQIIQFEILIGGLNAGCHKFLSKISLRKGMR